MNAITTLHPDAVRASLQQFWGDVLEIAPGPAGLTLAMPVSQPDGWQIVVELRQLTPGYIRLSDEGRTLQGLAGQGQNIEAEGFRVLLQQRMEAFHLSRDGRELYRDLHLPVEGMDIHLFAEGLAGVAHLCCLHQPAAKTEDVVGATVERAFRDHHLSFERSHRLSGVIERKVIVDYYAELRHPVAVQLLHRRGDVTGLMEQWGFRWHDLKTAHPRLAPAMIYDPAVSAIDGTARSIGESVCTLFCAYYETERIHEYLTQAGVAD